MLEKVKTVPLFLKQPKLYPQLSNLVKSRLLDDNIKQERKAATQWCRERTVSVEEAFANITGEKLTSIRQRFKNFINAAEKRTESCPVTMGGPGDVDLLYSIREYLQATKVIETGVAYGWSSLAILLSLSNRPGSKLISSDMPYAKMGNEDYVGCVVHKELRNMWQLIRLPDRQALPQALAALGSIDLCHYDSDKSTRGKRWAYPLLWNALRAEGVFISDDIGDDFAFCDFAAEVGTEPIVIRSYADEQVEKYVGILIKTK